MSKISVIIPIYNAEPYLKRCLDSIINQTYKNIEIVCINDGSKDNSLQILKEYQNQDERIIIIDKYNEGVSSARNDGINKSTGKYITFVDSDDWLELDAIETLYNTIIEKNVDVVRANYYKNFEYEKNASVSDLGNLSNVKFNTSEETFAAEVVDKFLSGKIPCFLWLLLVKREAVLKTSLFKKDIQLMEDTIFYVELLSSIEEIYFLDKPTYHYYSNQNSCTRAPEYYIRNMYNIVRVNKYIKEILLSGRYNEPSRIKMLNSIHTNMIINYIFIMYKSNMDKKELINELDRLLEDKEALYIIKNSEIQHFPIHLKLPIILILKKKYKTLFNFYKLRSLMSKFKDVLFRRKE